MSSMEKINLYFRYKWNTPLFLIPFLIMFVLMVVVFTPFAILDKVLGWIGSALKFLVS